jgi:hypothetical protein
MKVEDGGMCEGDTCLRYGCEGKIRKQEGSCSCHNNPPCSYCTANNQYCDTCDWDEEEEGERDPLDETKIDWDEEDDTYYSLIRKGVAPYGTTQEDILEEVKGHFGGRFTYFYEGNEENPCRFRYVALTDLIFSLQFT